MLSEGDRYQQLEPASNDLTPRAAPEAIDDGLDGWAFMMRTTDRELALLYFERKAATPRVKGLTPDARHEWTWFDPRTGRWIRALDLRTGPEGSLTAPRFPESDVRATDDWAAKLTRHASKTSARRE
jgi:hypothetical protein